jgi:hypothetical protein
MNLRVAAASRGFHLEIQLLPDSGMPEWLARATVSRASGRPATEGELAEFIAVRRTCRKRFLPREVDSVTQEQLVEAAGIEGAWLRPLLSEDARQQAASLVAEGDAAQWADPGWRRELAAWMHPRRHGDGLSVPALLAPVVQFAVSTFDMGGRVGEKDRELAAASPLLAVLGTDGDRPHDWLLAGQALQRTLLAACKDGLQASYLNQPIQVAELRPRLREFAGGGFPQMMLRFGYPDKAPPAAPRREVSEVIQMGTMRTESTTE